MSGTVTTDLQKLRSSKRQWISSKLRRRRNRLSQTFTATAVPFLAMVQTHRRTSRMRLYHEIGFVTMLSFESWALSQSHVDKPLWPQMLTGDRQDLLRCSCTTSEECTVVLHYIRGVYIIPTYYRHHISYGIFKQELKVSWFLKDFQAFDHWSSKFSNCVGRFRIFKIGDTLTKFENRGNKKKFAQDNTRAKKHSISPHHGYKRWKGGFMGSEIG